MAEGLSLIWDLDGTLLDTYAAITAAAGQVAEGHGRPMGREEILAGVKTTSVLDLLNDLAGQTGEDGAELWAEYRALERTFPKAPLMAGAAETLAALREMGCRHFVFTHKGLPARGVLRELGLAPFFEEVVSVADGFPRKPAPEGISYLVEKYGLDRRRTYYVGDRDLDAQCARNAGVGSILLAGPYLKEKADFRVERLEDIPALTEKL